VRSRDQTGWNHLRGEYSRNIIPDVDGHGMLQKCPCTLVFYLRHLRLVVAHHVTSSYSQAIPTVITIFRFIQGRRLVTWFSVPASLRLTPSALIAARYDLTTTRGCATAWGYV
jgi:hypothetical protein